ncbi:MAG: PEP-CTERM sorting domain-containing protein [Planctomycetota bacterium]
MKTNRLLATIAAVVAALPSAAHATTFAVETIAYTPGSDVFLINSNAALGKPAFAIPGFPAGSFEDPDTGAVINFPLTPAEPLSPFVPHFGGDQLTQIGPGGELIVRLERFVEVGAGPELGVFGNVGLIDSGGRTATGGAFGIDAIRIEVSETGQPGSWAPLAGGDPVVIDDPASFFIDAAGVQSPDDTIDSLLPLVENLTEADFGQPFVDADGPARFTGLTITQIEAELAGSAGGDWFDLNGLLVNGQPLERVGFVRFFDPTEPFELMAVSINSDLAGPLVPEPTSIVLLAGVLVASFATRTR